MSNQPIGLEQDNAVCIACDHPTKPRTTWFMVDRNGTNRDLWWTESEPHIVKTWSCRENAIPYRFRLKQGSPRVVSFANAVEIMKKQRERETDQ